MKIDIFMDEEDIVVYPLCQIDGCGTEVKSVSYEEKGGVNVYDVLEGTSTTMTFNTIAYPCGHVQLRPEDLVWVTRDGEPDCGA